MHENTPYFFHFPLFEILEGLLPPLPPIWRRPWAYTYVTNRWGYSLQKTLRGSAPNMGSRISLLIYQPLKWINFSIFSKIWAKIGSNSRKFEKKLWKIQLNLRGAPFDIGGGMEVFWKKKITHCWDWKKKKKKKKKSLTWGVKKKPSLPIR